MDNANHSDELMHSGIKGMRWGIRRYQNPDGSLTPAGRKRYQNPDGTLTKKGEKFYAQESARLKAETAKVKEAEKVATAAKRTQAKFTRLADKQKKLDERKKALDENQEETTTDKLKNKNKEQADKPEETLEQRRERLLKSTDPKELYEGRNDLTYQELNDRINRIDLEARLQSKIPKEEKRTLNQTMDKASETISKATNLYSSVDKAYSTVVNSAIGKTLAKKLGIEPPKEKFDLKKFVKNMDYESDAEVQAKAVRVRNMDTLKNALKELNADSGGTAGTSGSSSPDSPSGGSKSSSSPSPSGGSGGSSPASPASPSGGSGSSSSPSLPSPSSASSSSSIFRFFESSGGSGSSSSSGGSRTTRPAAASKTGPSRDELSPSERVRATSDRLAKMDADSSEAVSKIQTGRDITTDLLRRNNDLLNGNK